MREIARFVDVYEAEVAASFLAANGIHAFVAERTVATMQPLLQTAVGGVRLLTSDDDEKTATELLQMARAGAFAGPQGDDIKPRVFRPITLVIALTALIVGQGYGGQPFMAQGRLSLLHLSGLVRLGVALVVWIASIAAWLGGAFGPA